MKDITQSTWYQGHIEPLIAEHGMFPPLWVYMPDSHPYSIGWRMGGGEDFVTLFWQWWNSAQMTEQQRIEYFKYFPAPPRWYEWIADAIWDLDPFEDSENFDYTPYFERLKELGFVGIDQFEVDIGQEAG